MQIDRALARLRRAEEEAERTREEEERMEREAEEASRRQGICSYTLLSCHICLRTICTFFFGGGVAFSGDRVFFFSFSAAGQAKGTVGT